VGVAAKAIGLPCLVVCQKGREDLYVTYNSALFDHVILLDRFSDIAKPDILRRITELNTIFVPNRSFSVYVGYDTIELDFPIPLYGNRRLLRAEERSEKKNQYGFWKRRDRPQASPSQSETLHRHTHFFGLCSKNAICANRAVEWSPDTRGKVAGPVGFEPIGADIEPSRISSHSSRTRQWTLTNPSMSHHEGRDDRSTKNGREL